MLFDERNVVKMYKTGIEPRMQTSKVRSLPLDDIIHMQAPTQVEVYVCHDPHDVLIFFLIYYLILSKFY